MGKDIMTPEERLLALIKGKKEKPASPAIGNSDSKEIGPQALSKKWFHLPGIFKYGLFKNKVFEPVFLKSFNKYLVGIFLILTAYLIFDILFIKPYKNIASLISRISTQAANPAGTERKTDTEVKDYSYYSQEISAKKIFSPTYSGESPSQSLGVQDDISSNLSLVGIIAGENPQAIIEDKKTQKVYYLNKNQSFNGFTVEEISGDKVVLNYEGRKIMLVL